MSNVCIGSSSSISSSILRSQHQYILFYSTKTLADITQPPKQPNRVWALLRATRAVIYATACSLYPSPSPLSHLIQHLYLLTASIYSSTSRTSPGLSLPLSSPLVVKLGSGLCPPLTSTCGHKTATSRPVICSLWDVKICAHFIRHIFNFSPSSDQLCKCTARFGCRSTL